MRRELLITNIRPNRHHQPCMITYVWGAVWAGRSTILKQSRFSRLLPYSAADQQRGPGRLVLSRLSTIFRQSHTLLPSLPWLTGGVNMIILLYSDVLTTQTWIRPCLPKCTLNKRSHSPPAQHGPARRAPPLNSKPTEGASASGLISRQTSANKKKPWMGGEFRAC